MKSACCGAEVRIDREAKYTGISTCFQCLACWRYCGAYDDGRIEQEQEDEMNEYETTALAGCARVIAQLKMENEKPRGQLEMAGRFMEEQSELAKLRDECVRKMQETT